MADVFISYSSKDRALAEALARDIEAAGWSVWWDPAIRAGENYRDVIVRELDAAKAVVVIWTKHSVKSEWVISEAGRAMRKPRDRYVAVREGGLDEHDIPQPFNVRHAASLDDRAAILSSVERLKSESTHANNAGYLGRWQYEAEKACDLMNGLKYYNPNSNIARKISYDLAGCLHTLRKRISTRLDVLQVELSFVACAGAWKQFPYKSRIEVLIEGEVLLERIDDLRSTCSYAYCRPSESDRSHFEQLIAEFLAKFPDHPHADRVQSL